MGIEQDKTGLGAAEARFAIQVAARLSEDCEQLPADIAERLKGVRAMVVHRAAARRQAVASRPLLRLGNTLAFGGDSSGWRIALGLLLAVPTLMFGLYALQHYQQERSVHRIADIDTALLLDDLPPQAYVDPGFRSYLRRMN